MAELGEIPYPRIVRDASILGGEPAVAGTRVSVTALVRAHQLGMDFDEILVQYPSLTAADLHAAFLYYLDHKEDVDALLTARDEPPPGAEPVGD